MVENFWKADIYSRFLKARTRPARDLLAAVPESLNPKLIYDLGCGPGNSTILLKQRWPNAKVIGVDSSVDMLQQARSEYNNIDFIEADIAQFSAPEKIDLIFSNAAIQWLPNHENLIGQLSNNLNKNALLAIQMPNNFHCPSHQSAIKILQNNASWKKLLTKLRYGPLTEPLYKINNYYDFFITAGLTDIDLWETEYFLEIPNHQAIYEWTSGTGLRPILSCLNDNDKTLFVEQYIDHLIKAYPTQPNAKILFPYRRIFMLGVKT